MRNHELANKLGALLEADRFRDYAPNGLQVEGREEISRVVTGVTASRALIEAAADLRADAVLVHHGWFWKGESPCLTGIRRSRAARILGLGMNLFAYHLPLDAHSELGNNAQLARLLGISPQRRWGEMDLGWSGTLDAPVSVRGFIARTAAVLGRQPAAFGPLDREIRRVSWCSGAAQDFFEEAIIGGTDLFFSGEVSEQTVHLANEAGVTFLACGHHATERFGIRALGDWVFRNCGVEVTHVDICNPV